MKVQRSERSLRPLIVCNVSCLFCNHVHEGAARATASCCQTSAHASGLRLVALDSGPADFTRRKVCGLRYMPQDGDGEIVVRNIATGVDWRAPRGYRPPVPPPDDPGTNVAEFQAEQARLLRPVFTADSRFVVFGTEPTKAEEQSEKREEETRRHAEERSRIMDLSNGTVTRIEKVKTFRVPEDGSGFIAYSLEAKPEAETRAADWSSNAKLQRHRIRNAKPPPAQAGHSRLRQRHLALAASQKRRNTELTRPAQHDHWQRTKVQRRARLHDQQRREDARLHHLRSKRRRRTASMPS